MHEDEHATHTCDVGTKNLPGGTASFITHSDAVCYSLEHCNTARVSEKRQYGAIHSIRLEPVANILLACSPSSACSHSYLFMLLYLLDELKEVLEPRCLRLARARLHTVSDSKAAACNVVCSVLLPGEITSRAGEVPRWTREHVRV